MAPLRSWRLGEREERYSSVRRFHLLSYLAGIVTIGVLMGVNIQYCRASGTRTGLNDARISETQKFGFPFDAYTRRGGSISQAEYERLRGEYDAWAYAARVWEANPGAKVYVGETEITRSHERYVFIEAAEWSVWGVVLNVGVVLIYVLLVMTFFEAILQHRARGKAGVAV